MYYDLESKTFWFQGHGITWYLKSYLPKIGVIAWNKFVSTLKYHDISIWDIMISRLSHQWILCLSDKQIKLFMLVFADKFVRLFWNFLNQNIVLPHGNIMVWFVKKLLFPLDFEWRYCLKNFSIIFHNRYGINIIEPRNYRCIEKKCLKKSWNLRPRLPQTICLASNLYIKRVNNEHGWKYVQRTKIGLSQLFFLD